MQPVQLLRTIRTSHASTAQPATASGSPVVMRVDVCNLSVHAQLININVHDPNLSRSYCPDSYGGMGGLPYGSVPDEAQQLQAEEAQKLEDLP
jgi:hypothetical protein